MFLTDGQSDIDKAVAAARTDTRDVRLFTLGLGKDVNKPLLQRLAAQKRGRFVYIERASDIEREVGRLAKAIASPLLVDVSIEVSGVQAMRLYPRTMPDVFAEDELVVTGRVRGSGAPRFVVRGKLGGKPVELTAAAAPRTAPGRPWIAALWAQARVDHLLEELALNPNQPELVTEVTELALTYHFVTPYTAFLAVPESELGDTADVVAAAREHREKLVADATGDGEAIPAGEVIQVEGQAPSQRSSLTSMAPTIESATIEDSAPLVPPGTAVRKRGGCAGCASTEAGGAASWLLVALVLASVVLRRGTGRVRQRDKRDTVPRPD